MQVTGTRVLVKDVPLPDFKEINGILIKEDQRHSFGEIVAVGEAVGYQNGVDLGSALKVGTRVYYLKTSEALVTIKGVNYYVADQSGIVLIFDKDEWRNILN